MIVAAIALTAAIAMSLENNVPAFADPPGKTHFVSADPSPARNVSDYRRLCSGYDTNDAISACTQLIRSGHEPANQIFVEYYNRGSAFFRNGDFDHAIADYGEAARLNPGDPDCFISLGRSYEAKADDDMAIRNYTRAIALDPANAAAYRSRGDAYFRNHDNDHAIRDYHAALRLNPDDDLAQSSLVSAQLKLLPYP
jgi:tetratricopeptide (TPR) repeat protein